MNTLDVNLLPQDVLATVKETLTAYPKTWVTRENGQYTHTAGLSLDTRIKAKDFATFEFRNTDFYTKEQIA